MLSPVLPSPDANDNSMMGHEHSSLGALKSWLDVNPVNVAGIDSPQTNWLSSMPGPDGAPESARNNASANWLRAPAGDDDFFEGLASQRSITPLQATPKVRRARSRSARPLNYLAVGETNVRHGQGRHKAELPPLPLTLPPLPPTPPALEGLGQWAHISELDAVGVAPERSGATPTSFTDTVAATGEGRSHSSFTLTPVTPNEDPDTVYTESKLDGLGDRLRAIGSKIPARTHGLPLPRKLPRQGWETISGFSNEVEKEWSSRAMNDYEPYLQLDPAPRNGHAANNHNLSAHSNVAPSSPPSTMSAVAPIVSGRLVSGHTQKVPGWPESAPSAGQNAAREARVDVADSPRMEKRHSPGDKPSKQPLNSGLMLREHLNNFRYSCGTIAEGNRSRNQKRCYDLYFSPWKRWTLTVVITFHSSLAFAELHVKSYSRRAASLDWQSAAAWIQGLHFLCVLVYIVDMIIMTIGLTFANLNPSSSRNARNISFLTVVALIAADTLLTAASAATNSYSLPLRGVLLMSQLPRTVSMFNMWARMVYASMAILSGISFVLVCLAAIAVVAIRDQCPYQGCGARTGTECAETRRAECDTLLSHVSDFPSALVILWNLAGGAGHVDNLAPFLESNRVFGRLYFLVSSAVCTVWFRFMWLAVVWQGVKHVSRQDAQVERREFMQLLCRNVVPERSKHVSIRALAQTLSSVWPHLTEQQTLQVLKAIYGDDHKDSILSEHAGALSWLLHADSHCGISVPAWMCVSWNSPSFHVSNAAPNSHAAGSWRRVFFLHGCAILSFTMLVVSAWLPDTGVACTLHTNEPSPAAWGYAVNRGFEWLDVLLCGVFLIDMIWMVALDRLRILTSLTNILKLLQVMTETLLICSLFRDQGMGNKAMILRLLRVPRLFSIIQHLCIFKLFLEFTQVALVASAQIFLVGLVFVFFFGSVTWQAVVFTVPRAPGIVLDFSAFSSSCYTVYLMVIGQDWHLHTSAIFDALDSSPQRFAFVLLFVAQFIGGQVLLYMSVSVILESWSMCRKTHTALNTTNKNHPIRFKCARIGNDVSLHAAAAMALMPWAGATLCLGRTGLTFEFKTDDPQGLYAEQQKAVYLAYSRVGACCMLDNDAGSSGLDPETSAACIVLRAQDRVILIDASHPDTAEQWLEAFKVLSRRARVDFRLDAAVTVHRDGGVAVHDLLHPSNRVHVNYCYARVRRKCTAMDIWIHDFEHLPTSLPVNSGDESWERVAARGNLDLRGRLGISHSPQLDSVPLKPHQPSSGGNEMSCRTTGATPKGTPRKLPEKSPRLTPRDARMQRDLADAAMLTSDEDAAKDQMIAAVEMFKGLRPGDANAVAARMRVLTASSGSILIHPGQCGTVMMRVLSGLATEYEDRKTSTRSEAAVAVRTLERGTMYGHHQLFQDNLAKCANLSVAADTDCKYVVLTKNALLELLVRDSLRCKLTDNAAWLGNNAAWLLHFKGLHPDDTSECTEYTERTHTERSHRSNSTVSKTANHMWDGERKRATKEGNALRRRIEDDELAENLGSKTRETLAVKPKAPKSGKKTTPRTNTTKHDTGEAELVGSCGADSEYDGMVEKGRVGREGVHTSLTMSNQPQHVTLASNGPAPVYFSADLPASKVGGATSADPSPTHVPPPRVRASNSNADANLEHHVRAEEDQVPRASATRDVKTIASSSNPRSASSSRAHTRAALWPSPIASTAPRRNGAVSTGARVRPQTTAPASPATPIINREDQTARLNNNVVLPPGAKLDARVARTLDVAAEEGDDGSQADTPESLTGNQAGESWT